MNPIFNPIFWIMIFLGLGANTWYMVIKPWLEIKAWKDLASRTEMHYEKNHFLNVPPGYVVGIYRDHHIRLYMRKRRSGRGVISTMRIVLQPTPDTYFEDEDNTVKSHLTKTLDRDNFILIQEPQTLQFEFKQKYFFFEGIEWNVDFLQTLIDELCYAATAIQKPDTNLYLYDPTEYDSTEFWRIIKTTQQ